MKDLRVIGSLNESHSAATSRHSDKIVVPNQLLADAATIFETLVVFLKVPLVIFTRQLPFCCLLVGFWDNQRHPQLQCCKINITTN